MRHPARMYPRFGFGTRAQAPQADLVLAPYLSALASCASAATLGGCRSAVCANPPGPRPRAVFRDVDLRPTPAILSP
jgi:hypothetical protein